MTVSCSSLLGRSPRTSYAMRAVRVTRWVTLAKIALKAEFRTPLLRTVTSVLPLLVPFNLRGVAGVQL